MASGVRAEVPCFSITCPQPVFSRQSRPAFHCHSSHMLRPGLRHSSRIPSRPVLRRRIIGEFGGSKSGRFRSRGVGGERGSRRGAETYSQRRRGKEGGLRIFRKTHRQGPTIYLFNLDARIDCHGSYSLLYTSEADCESLEAGGDDFSTPFVSRCGSSVRADELLMRSDNGEAAESGSQFSRKAKRYVILKLGCKNYSSRRIKQRCRRDQRSFAAATKR